MTDVDLELDTSRRSFESAIEGEYTSIVECMQELLDRLALADQDIGVVFLTGGTTRVPRVRRMFEERFGADRIADQNVFTSVTRGLGVEALEQFG